MKLKRSEANISLKNVKVINVALISPTLNTLSLIKKSSNFLLWAELSWIAHQIIKGSSKCESMFTGHGAAFIWAF